MDTHGVEVFDHANDDDVIVGVAQQFQFVLFPAQHGFFHQHLVGRGSGQAAAQGCVKFFLLVYEAPTGAAQRIGRADNQGKTNFLGGFFAFQKRVGDLRGRYL